MRESNITIRFSSDFRNVDLARMAVTGLMKEFFKEECHRSRVIDFCLAITEAMNNVVEHSRARILDMDVIVSENEACWRIFVDADRFDPTVKKDMPDLQSCEELPDSGYGIPMIQQLVDEMVYDFIDGKNVLTLRKSFAQDSPQDSVTGPMHK